MSTETQIEKINPDVALYVGLTLIVLTALGKTMLPGAGVMSLLTIVVCFFSVLCITPNSVVSGKAKRALAIAGAVSCGLCYIALSVLSPLITQ